LTGPTGPTGPTGAASTVAGPTGPTGPGPGITSFGYVYNTTPSLLVPAGTAITFSANGPLQDIVHIVGTAPVIVANTGTYQIDYSVLISAGLGTTISLAINGTVDPSTTVGSIAIANQISGTAMLSLAAGDSLTLVNSSGVALTLFSIGVNAQLNIIQLST
jgi:hypothetical protein